MRRRDPIVAAAAAAFLCLIASPIAAAPSPLEYTRSILEQTRLIVDGQQPHNGKLTALSDLLKKFLDTDTMGRAALGNNWDKFKPDQQQEFLSLFRELFQRTYVQKLLLFERPDFEYVGEKIDKNTAQADTKIVTPRDEFAVVYRLRRDGERWLATDIQIEDLSLTTNFRRQLDRMLAKSTPEEVLSRMRRKYGPGGKGAEDEEL